MHFGSTLRLLRLDSGLSLRDLARRLSVSSTYLSRVENGLDSAPTPARLKAIARELALPEPLLLGLAHQVSPLIVDYAREDSEAAALFLEIARRRLSALELQEVRAFIDMRFPRPDRAATLGCGRIVDLLEPDRVVVGMTCCSIDDVFDVAGGRLAKALGKAGPAISALLKTREHEVSSAIGGGVALSSLHVDVTETVAAIVTLAQGIEHETPDRMPLRAVVVLAGPASSAVRRLQLLQLARMTARDLSSKLDAAVSSAEVLSCLAGLEA